MNRYASPIVKLAFEGPDVHEESLYDILRVSNPSSGSFFPSVERFFLSSPTAQFTI